MKLINSILKYTAVIGMIIFMDACEKDSGPDVKPVPIDTTHYVSFSLELQPIFDDRCINCHNQSHPFLDLRSCCSYGELLSSGTSAPYVDLHIPELSIIYEHVQGIHMAIMPPNGPPLTDNQIALILLWIKQGAKNN